MHICRFRFDTNLLVIKVFYFMLWGGRFTFVSYFAAFAESYGFRTSYIGYFFTIMNAGFFLGSMLMSYFMEKTGKEKITVYVSFIFIILSISSIPFVTYGLDNRSNQSCHLLKNCNSVIFNKSLDYHNSTSKKFFSSVSPPLSMYISLTGFSIICSFFHGICCGIDLIMIRFCRLYSSKVDTYDRQRPFGSFGSGMLPMFTGILLDFNCRVISYFFPVFTVSSLSYVIALFCCYHLLQKTESLENKRLVLEEIKDSINTKYNGLAKQFIITFKKPGILLISFMSFLLGAANSLWFGFLLLVMNKQMLHSNKFIFGLTLTSQCFADVIISRFSAKIVRRIGNRYHVMSFSLLIYGLAFIATAICTHSYVMPIVGILPGVSYAFFFLPQQHEIVRLVDRSCTKMVNSFQYGIYYFFGGGLSAVFGGIAFIKYGAKYTFIIFGVAMIFGFVISLVVIYLFIKNSGKTKNDNSLLVLKETNV